VSGNGDAIIVCDMQNGFINDLTRHLPSRIAAFLAQKHYKHRVFTRFVNPGEGSFYDQHLNWTKMQLPAETSIVAELEQFPTLVSDRNFYSVFRNGELDDWLNDHSIIEAHVCGVYTNVSVLSAAGCLFDRRVRLVVVSDLCGSHSGLRYHTAGLTNLKKWVGDRNVIPSEGIFSV